MPETKRKKQFSLAIFLQFIISVLYSAMLVHMTIVLISGNFTNWPITLIVYLPQLVIIIASVVLQFILRIRHRAHTQEGSLLPLLFSFIVGLGLSYIEGRVLHDAFADFQQIITKLIAAVIIPLLPLHIFGIFLNMTVSGHVASIILMFLKVIIVIFILHVLLLLIQFAIAGAVSGKNPMRLLKNMLPAYATALGTQSSAATIPVTLAQTIQNGVREAIAIFVIPLCATIHLAGSTMKITACAMAILYMTGEPITFGSMAGFIMMLGITMVAAPGVPGGAIMAALGILQTMLGFNETLQALMIALYIAMDSFGTACNVTGDGAIAVIVDRIAGERRA